MKKCLLTLLLLFTTALPALAAPTNTSSSWGVDVGAFANFSTAAKSTATAGKDMIVSRVISVNTLTVPNDRVTVVAPGGKLNIGSGKTLTLPYVRAGAYQIKSGTGTLALLPGAAERVYPEWVGAKGDGSTSDSAKIQEAINLAAGKAVLWLSKGKSYRITSGVTFPSNLSIDGEGELLIDYVAGFGSAVFSAQGTIGSQTALSANVLATDVTISMASTAGYSAGDLVAIGSTLYSGAWPVVIKVIKSLTSNTITFDSPVGVAYAISNSAYVQKITPVSNISIKDITIRCSSTSDTENILYFKGVKGLILENIKINSQRGVSNPGATAGLYIESSYDVKVFKNRGDAFSGAGGNFITVATSSEVLTADNQSHSYAFGIGYYSMFNSSISNNILYGPADGVRAIKIYGSYGINVTANQAHNFQTGLKVEGTSHSLFKGNQLWDMTSHAINLSASASNAPNNNDLLVGNYVYNCSTMGIYADVYTAWAQIDGNFIFNSGSYGMYLSGNSLLINNNFVSGFGVAGIAFAQLSTVNGNWIYDSTNTRPSLTLLGTFSPGNAAVLSGNIATNNPLDSAGNNPLYFSYSIFSGNNIKGVAYRVFYGTAAPTTSNWVVGDTVINTNPTEQGSASSKYIITGWKCVVAGNPGTWRESRALTGN